MILSPRDIQIAKLSSKELFLHADAIVGVALHNQAKTIASCLNSMFEQKIPNRKVAVVLLDDNSKDNWEEKNSGFLGRPEILI